MRPILASLQAGGTQDRSTALNVLVTDEVSTHFRHMLQNSTAFRKVFGNLKNVHFVKIFLDFVQAYDCVDRDKMYAELRMTLGCSNT